MEFIAENSKVKQHFGSQIQIYNSGYEKGYDRGYFVGYEDGEAHGGVTDDVVPWDYIQKYGTRLNYANAFNGWDWEYANPKYKITLTNQTCNSLFDNNAKLKTINKEKFDFTNATNLNYLFRGCSALEYMPDMNLAGRQWYETFKGCGLLKKIDRIDFSYVVVYTNHINTFSACYMLEEISKIDGEIKWNVDLGDSTRLNKKTIVNIVNALSSTATGCALTLSSQAVNKAFETSEGAFDGSSSLEWDTAMLSKGNWTFSLR